MRIGLVATFLSALSWVAIAQVPQQNSGRWFKGNLHTHTVNSDGDSSPDAVARWYKEHGYDFLSLTDHNFLTPTGGLSDVFGAPGKFLMVPGEEVTSGYEGAPIHINALDVRSQIEPASGESVADTIQRNIDRILGADALPSVNHPNFRWAISTEDLLKLSNLKLFEVYNGHPTVNNDGGGGRPGLEEMWDALLTAGSRTYGIAVDDAHHFKTLGQQYSNPGRGWVMVKADELTVPALMRALKNGEFYASTGVVLDDVERLSDGLRLRMPESTDTRFTIEFIGAGGEILERTFDDVAEYRLRAGQSYVRALVTDSNGWRAWIQPVFAN